MATPVTPVTTPRTLAREQRLRILAREQALAATIGASYASAQRDIQLSIDTFTQAYADAEDEYDDGDVPVSWLQQSGQLPQVQHRTRAAVDAFALATLFALLHGQRQAAYQGADDAGALVSAALAPVSRIAPTALATALFPRRISGDALAAFLGKSQTTGNPLSSLLNRLGDATAQQVTKTLYTALASGSHPSVAARMLTQATGMARSRALTIARTEMLSAYRTASLAQFQANSDVLDGWIWLAAPTACPFCQEMNGTFHSLDEAMDTHPNCACVQSPHAKSLSSILRIL